MLVALILAAVVTTVLFAVGKSDGSTSVSAGSQQRQQQQEHARDFSPVPVFPVTSSQGKVGSENGPKEPSEDKDASDRATIGRTPPAHGVVPGGSQGDGGGAVSVKDADALSATVAENGNEAEVSQPAVRLEPQREEGRAAAADGGKASSRDERVGLLRKNASLGSNGINQTISSNTAAPEGGAIGKDGARAGGGGMVATSNEDDHPCCATLPTAAGESERHSRVPRSMCCPIPRVLAVI